MAGASARARFPVEQAAAIDIGVPINERLAYLIPSHRREGACSLALRSLTLQALERAQISRPAV
jgi:hypothetical protein